MISIRAQCDGLTINKKRGNKRVTCAICIIAQISHFSLWHQNTCVFLLLCLLYSLNSSVWPKQRSSQSGHIAQVGIPMSEEGKIGKPHRTWGLGEAWGLGMPDPEHQTGSIDEKWRGGHSNLTKPCLGSSKNMCVMGLAAVKALHLC